MGWFVSKFQDANVLEVIEADDLGICIKVNLTTVVTEDCRIKRLPPNELVDRRTKMGLAILTPAYGRDYKSKKAVLKDFNDEKDFILNDMSSPWNGKYVNRQQLTGYDHIHIRYKQAREIAVIR